MSETIAEQLLPAFQKIGEGLQQRTRMIGKGMESDTAPRFEPHPTPILEQSASGLASIYAPWVIRVVDIVPSPLGEFYMYYSTDHAGAGGAIRMAYADDPLGPWTVHGTPIDIPGRPAGIEPETPAVIPDPTGPGLILYHQQTGINSSQGTVYGTGTDGITWTYGGIAVGQRLTSIGGSDLPGDGHSGYLRPCWLRGALVSGYILICRIRYRLMCRSSGELSRSSL